MSLRYEVQDPEPDEAAGHGTTYKASANALIPIPKDSAGLPVYPVGKQVLARYPETTTFYRAEVMGTKVSIHIPLTRESVDYNSRIARWDLQA